MLKRDQRGAAGIHREFYSDFSIANFACDSRYASVDRAILRPGKTVKANNGVLSGMQLAERGRLEFGDHLRMSAWEDQA